eukprot:s3055_g2.t1
MKAVRELNGELEENATASVATAISMAAAFRVERKKKESLEQKLAETTRESKDEYEALCKETEETIQGREQTIRHQTSAIEALNRELKEKQVELDRLTELLAKGEPDTAPKVKPGVERVYLPPLGPKPMEDVEVRRAIEGLRKQLKAKDTKLEKQTERLQGLGELLEERDTQLQELLSARRDREKLRIRLADLEDAMKSQKKVMSRADAERRLIGQEARLKESERQIQELGENLQKERHERQAVTCELRALEERVKHGTASAESMDTANEAMSKELAVHQVELAAKAEQVSHLQQVLAESQAEVRKLSERVVPEPGEVAPLPALQRRLRKLEEADQTLARDVLVHLQDREHKIETLASTVALLRQTVDDLQPEQEGGLAQEGRDNTANILGSAPKAPILTTSTDWKRSWRLHHCCRTMRYLKRPRVPLAAEDGKNAGTFLLSLVKEGISAAEDGKNAGTFLLSLVKEAHPPDGKTHAVLRPGQLLQRSIQHWSSTRLLQVKHDAMFHSFSTEELGVLHEGFNPDSRISKGDQRISMVPDVAEQLIKDGYGVIVEKGAGVAFSDSC